ncbi:MAG: hypothetical protein R3C01_17015 [Planctomycetaceae bacterium]
MAAFGAEDVAVKGEAAVDTPNEKEASSEGVWQAISLRGERIGYGHQLDSTIERDGKSIVVTQTHVHSVVKRFDGKVTLILDKRVEESTDGTLLRFHFRMNNPPSSTIETTGEVQGTTLTLRSTSNGQTTETSAKLPAGVKSSPWVDRSLRQQTSRKWTRLVTIPLIIRSSAKL